MSILEKVHRKLLDINEKCMSVKSAIKSFSTGGGCIGCDIENLICPKNEQTQNNSCSCSENIPWFRRRSLVLVGFSSFAMIHGEGIDMGHREPI